MQQARVSPFGVTIRILAIVWWSLVAFFHFVLLLPVSLARGRGVRAHAARVFRTWLQNLGATFIKVGQILSTRPDILPEYVTTELALLQDRVPPFAASAARAVFVRELGKPPEEVFEWFEEEPMASASVAQVHRAQLRSGERVAVKVRRPKVVAQASFDESIMVFFARALSWIPTIDVLSPVETAQEFCAAVWAQLDLRNEARNNHRFQEHFAGDPEIRFPRLYEELCGEAVLTMEFVDGVKDSEIDSLGLDRAKLARIGVRAILKMVYADGFVHADLHPGNLLFQAGNRVTFIDLGMVGEVDKHRRLGLAAMVLALAQGDGRTVARFMYEGSPRKEVKNYDRFEADVVALVAKMQGKSLHELEMSVFIASVFEILRRNRLRADAGFTTINIAMLVVEGLGKKLDPSLDLFTEIQPFLMQLVASSPELYRRVVTDATPRPDAA